MHLGAPERVITFFGHVVVAVSGVLRYLSISKPYTDPRGVATQSESKLPTPQSTLLVCLNFEALKYCNPFLCS